MFFNGPLHMDVLVLTDHQELTNNSSVQTQDIVWKACMERWMIGMDGERKSQGKSCKQRDLMMIYKQYLISNNPQRLIYHIRQTNKQKSL